MGDYTLSDFAAVANEGIGNGSVWLIILFMLIFGGNGFGNRDSAIADNEILSGQKFDTISRQVNSVGDGICSATYNLAEKINGVQNSLGNAITNEGRSIQTQLCAINNNIDDKFAALEKSQLEQKIAEQSQQINQLSMQQMLCGIPKVNNTAWGVYPYNNNNACCGNV